MKLWIILRIGKTDWDEHRGFVIRAESEEAARKIADKNSVWGEEGLFLSSSKSSCIELHQDGPEKLILSDYKEG